MFTLENRCIYLESFAQSYPFVTFVLVARLCSLPLDRRIILCLAIKGMRGVKVASSLIRDIVTDQEKVMGDYAALLCPFGSSGLIGISWRYPKLNDPSTETLIVACNGHVMDMSGAVELGKEDSRQIFPSSTLADSTTTKICRTPVRLNTFRDI